MAETEKERKRRRETRENHLTACNRLHVRRVNESGTTTTKSYAVRILSTNPKPQSLDAISKHPIAINILIMTL